MSLEKQPWRIQEMQNGKAKPPSYLNYRRLLVLLLLSLLLSLIVSIKDPFKLSEYQRLSVYLAFVLINHVIS